MTSLLIAAIVATAAAAVQSGTGFGFALVLGPAMLAPLPAGQALTIVLALGLELNLLVLGAERRERMIAWAQLRGLLLASLPGLVAGALVVRAIPKATLGHSGGRLLFERLSARRHEVLILLCVVLAGSLSLAAGIAATR